MLSSKEYPDQDEGCDLFPACLRCPLPTCRYDDPERFAREARQARDQQVLRLARDEGYPPSELATAFNISVRTVHRILCKDSGAQSSLVGR